MTLTHAGAREIARFPYLHDRTPPLSVIPTCADLKLFRPGSGRDDSIFTFGYVGSVGTWYLLDETLAFFRVIAERRPDAQLLVVNRNEHEAIRAAVEKAGIETSRVEIAAAEHGDVPKYIARMHAGAAIITALIFQDCERADQACGISRLRRALRGQYRRWRRGGDFGRKMCGRRAARIYVSRIQSRG